MLERPRTLTAVLTAQLNSEGMNVGYYNRHSHSFEDISLKTVLDRCAVTAGRLLNDDAKHRRPVMVAGSTPAGLWEGFLACVLAGRAAVLLPIRPSLDGREKISAKLLSAEARLPEPVLMIQSTGGMPCIEPGGRRWIPLTDNSSASATDILASLNPEPDDTLHLQFTSGSTGDFKPVVLTHRNVIASVNALVDRMTLGPDDHVVSWLPLYHDMGLVGMALAALVAGANLRLLSPFDFLADPVHWLRGIEDSPGAVTAAPNFAFDYTTRRARIQTSADLDLSNWKKCYCGAEPVDSGTVARFVDRFLAHGLRPEVVHPTYGLAETTLMVTMPRSGELPKHAIVGMSDLTISGQIAVRSVEAIVGYSNPEDADVTSIACLGPPATGVRVEIVSDDGKPSTEQDFCGEVVVRGDVVSPGYLQPDGSLEVFDDGCRTGDIGFLHDGELYLVERRRNMIIRNGQNYSAAAFESHLSKRLGVPLDSCAVLQRDTTAESITAVVESTRGVTKAAMVAAAGSVVSTLDLPIDELLVVDRNAIPRTTSGKKQHVKLRQALRQGELTPLAILPVAGDYNTSTTIDLRGERHTDAARRIVERYARRSGWRGVALTDDLDLADDLGLDSLRKIEMMVDIDNETGVGIPESRLGNLTTVGAVLALVESSPSDGTTDTTNRAGNGIAWAVDQLASQIPQVNCNVSEQSGRNVRIDGRWYLDFGGVNYLGLDLHPEVASAIGPAIERWGVHPSWTRAVASPGPYRDLELQLAGMIGAPDSLIFSTITLAHIGLIPLLATGTDSVVVDQAAHNSIAEGAELAAARGAELRQFDHTRLETLEAALDRCRGRPLVAVDGVYSMTGDTADLTSILRLTKAKGGLVYVDDAHGFGVLGAHPDERLPYGYGGGGIAAHLGLDYENVVYVAGLSKAFSSMAAFVSCADETQRKLFQRASTSVFSGPVPVASLASAQAGIEINLTQGDDLRSHLHKLTRQVTDGLTDLGFPISNPLSFPIINVPIGGVSQTIAASRVMWEHRILFTPSVFPAAALESGGFRLSLTATHSEGDVDQLLEAIGAVARERDRTRTVRTLEGQARRSLADGSTP